MDVKDTKGDIGLVITSKVKLDLDKWIRSFYITYEDFMGAKKTSEMTRYNIHSKMPDFDKYGNETDENKIVSIDVLCHNKPSVPLQINSSIPATVNKKIKYVLLFSSKDHLESRLECYNFKDYIERKTVASMDNSTVNVTFDISYKKQFDKDGKPKLKQNNGYRQILKWIRQDSAILKDYKIGMPKKEKGIIILPLTKDGNKEGEISIKRYKNPSFDKENDSSYDKWNKRKYSVTYNVGNNSSKIAEKFCDYIKQKN